MTPQTQSRRALADAVASPLETRSINLDGASLRHFPTEVLECVNLEELSMCAAIEVDFASLDGQLVIKPQSLPESLGSLQELRVLLLGNLTLGGLPQTIGDLQQLEVLSLRHNSQLEGLPPRLCGLSKLRVLNLAATPMLGSLPEDIGELGALEELRTRDSGFHEVPSSLVRLTRLRTLTLPSQVHALPRGFGALTQLRHLCLSAPALHSIAAELESLTQLEELRVLQTHDRPVAALPPQVGQLRALTRLFATSIGIEALCDLGRLEQLRELDVCGNGLTSVSEHIAGLPSLRRLSYADNPLPLRERRLLEFMMDLAPDERPTWVGKRAPKQPKPPKSVHLGQVCSTTGSILLLAGDAQVASRWQGTENGTRADDPSDSDWSLAFEAMHGDGEDRPFATVACGPDDLRALSIHIGGVIEVYRVEDRFVLVEGDADGDGRRKTSFKRYVGAMPSDNSTCAGHMHLPSGLLALLSASSPGTAIPQEATKIGNKGARQFSSEGERGILVAAAAQRYAVYLETPVERAWGDAARAVLVPVP